MLIRNAGECYRTPFRNRAELFRFLQNWPLPRDRIFRCPQLFTIQTIRVGAIWCFRLWLGSRME
jgi:hypothetical protein